MGQKIVFTVIWALIFAQYAQVAFSFLPINFEYLYLRNDQLNVDLHGFL